MTSVQPAILEVSTCTTLHAVLSTFSHTFISRDTHSSGFLTTFCCSYVRLHISSDENSRTTFFQWVKSTIWSLRHLARYFRRLVSHDTRFRRLFRHRKCRRLTCGIPDDDNLRLRLAHGRLKFRETRSVFPSWNDVEQSVHSDCYINGVDACWDSRNINIRVVSRGTVNSYGHVCFTRYKR